MSEFLPMGVPSDTALLLGYDIQSGKAVFVNSFEYGACVELRQWQWSKNWSHFIPFVWEDEAYYIRNNTNSQILSFTQFLHIAYKFADGKVHLVNAKTAHTYIDMFTGIIKAGFTHVVYMPKGENQFVMFFNSSTKDLSVMKIEIGKV